LGFRSCRKGLNDLTNGVSQQKNSKKNASGGSDRGLQKGFCSDLRRKAAKPEQKIPGGAKYRKYFVHLSGFANYLFTPGRNFT